MWLVVLSSFLTKRFPLSTSYSSLSGKKSLIRSSLSLSCKVKLTTALLVVPGMTAALHLGEFLLLLSIFPDFSLVIVKC